MLDIEAVQKRATKWIPSMLDIEEVQKRATKRILCLNQSYRDKLTNLKLVRLYAELNDLLYCLAIMTVFSRACL